MANMLAWLTGRDDQTAVPSPIQYGDGQPSLRTYNPTPSERFGNWISDALGAGPGASASHQAFAKGLPSVLSLFPPLGVGLSAADLLHAKAAGDPMGAAAAAIGMLPAVGSEARAGVKAINPLLEAVDKTKSWIHPNDIVFHEGQWWQKKGLPQTLQAEAKGTKPPVLDYEKDNNGLYHIFNVMTGKTQKVVDSHNEAKSWIAKQGDAKSIPITQINTGGSPMEAKAPDLLEAQKRYEATIAPLAQNLPERAQAQGYTTPAFRGMKIREGDVNPVYKYGNDTTDLHYSTGNPMLADMYSDYLSKHPGWQIPSDYFDKGASVAPLLLDTSKYHYYDAQGAHWSSAQGNMRGIQQAKDKGAPGVIVDNVWDEPNSTHALGTPSKVFITFPQGATTVKSRFAQMFDPSDPNMLHGLAGLGLGGAGLAALGSPSEAQAATPQRPQMVQPQSVTDKINEIMDGLDWQGQWMDRMRLPLENYAAKRRNAL